MESKYQIRQLVYVSDKYAPFPNAKSKFIVGETVVVLDVENLGENYGYRVRSEHGLIQWLSEVELTSDRVVMMDEKNWNNYAN